MDQQFVVQLIAFTHMALLTVGCAKQSLPDKSKTDQGGGPVARVRSTEGQFQHKIFYDVTYGDVRKTLPDNSVDHLHYASDASRSVIVVVTVAAQYRPGLTFETTFTTSSFASFTIPWKPAEGSNDAEHRGMFVVDDEVISASTIIK